MAHKKAEPTIRVIVNVKFIDKETGDLRKVGDVFDVTEKRYAEIVKDGLYVRRAEEAEGGQAEQTERPEGAEGGEGE